MPHPLIDQLRFTRTEWLRGFKGVSQTDAARHFGAMNSIGWTVGHLAWHEQQCWLERAQGSVLFPKLKELCGYGSPMSDPPLKEMTALWLKVTQASDPFLETLTAQSLLADMPRKSQASGQSAGSVMLRLIYHYWYHIGEIQAIRQMLGHTKLPVYVGNIETNAPFRME
jgi:hypothetical protein